MELGMKLDLEPARATGATKDAADESKFDDVRALQEEPITVTFVLPNGSTASQKFKKGHTVSVLKAFLSEECELDQDEVVLLLDGEIMLDPLSLTDFNAIVEASSIKLRVHHKRAGGSPSRK